MPIKLFPYFNLYNTMAEEELEQTLCVIKECFVYKIPPLKSATGHRASVRIPHYPSQHVIAN